MKTKVLFISHDAQPHGAQLLLLHLVRWVSACRVLDAHVLLKRDGPLRSDFEAVAPTRVFNAGNPSGLLAQCRQQEYDVLYSNTITNGELLQALTTYERPVITHVHELGYWIGHRTGPFNNAQVLAHTDHFIACSQAVADCLERLLRVEKPRISVVHEFVPTQTETTDLSGVRERIQADLNLPADSFIVGGSGTTDWRKGADLFVQVALHVRKRLHPNPIHFVWVGGDETGDEANSLRHDALQAGVAETVHFLGHKPNPRDFFALFDVMTLVSREDPYPLVVLEASALGVPTVTFDRNGGAGEFVEQDAGLVTPYLDVPAMAEQVVRLFKEPALRRKLGARAAQKVRERHELGASAGRIVNLIEWVSLNHRLQRCNAEKQGACLVKGVDKPVSCAPYSADSEEANVIPEPTVCASR